MKKNNIVYWFIFLFHISNSIFSQNFIPFSPRFNQDIKGDILVIGNNILNRNLPPQTPNDPFNGNTLNSNFDMQYIDIDSDPTTFCSSSADLDIPSVNCYKIAYAGLYWGALLQSGSRTDINKVKFKLPNGNYEDITGELIYDAIVSPIGSASSKPYVCYADVTNRIANLANPEGTYTLANVISSVGSNGNMGLSAGWTLFVVFEDSSLPTKAITSFDGFSAIASIGAIDIPMTGLRTVPVGPVRTKFAFASLEGDLILTGDNLKINGSTISNTQRSGTNFFNSSLTTESGYFTARNPNGSNTLGIDAGVMTILNPGNSIIPNNASGATIKISDNSDFYFYYFNAFANEIFNPDIKTSMIVQNLGGNNITGGTVNLSESIQYVISFQNIGNDSATNLTINTVIPNNVIFNPVDLIIPNGITYTYNASTRQLVFSIPNNLVAVGTPKLEIKINGTIASSCNNFKDACSNLISTQAFSSYFGLIGFANVDNSPSYSSISACTTSPTKITVNTSNCSYLSSQTMCNASTLELTAANGYTAYTWTGPAPSTNIIGTNQSLSISQSGTYTSVNTSVACGSITETFVVDYCFPINLVNQIGNNLYALENNASYQWIDCDNSNLPITGETGQSFAPQTSGNYAVIVTNQYGNTSTSNCIAFTFLDIKEFINDAKIEIYPNPVKDVLTISMKDNINKITLINMIGQTKEVYSQGKNTFNIGDIKSGCYLISFENNSEKKYLKMIKE